MNRLFFQIFIIGIACTLFSCEQYKELSKDLGKYLGKNSDNKLSLKDQYKKRIAEIRTPLGEKERKNFDTALLVMIAKKYAGAGQMKSMLDTKSSGEFIADAREIVEIQELGGIEGICKSLKTDLERMALKQESYFVKNGDYSGSVKTLLSEVAFTGSKWNVFAIAPYKVGKYQAFKVAVYNPKCLDNDHKPVTVKWDSGRGGFQQNFDKVTAEKER